MTSRPSELVGVARELASKLSKVEQPPAVIAARDQIHALQQERGGELRNFAATKHWHNTEGRRNDKTMAIELALLVAMMRRCTSKCPHALTVPPTTPLTACLALNVVACNACLPRLVEKARRKFVDDGRCDICDQATTTFHETVIQVGPILMLANACKECVAFSENALSSKSAGNR